MGIFSRFRDIVSSIINSMLDQAEDPEKLIRLMIREMEDTLVELKSSCAQALANQSKNDRMLAELEEQSSRWTSRAELAAEKGKTDLAREALVERKGINQKITDLNDNGAHLVGIVGQYKKDIEELEEKITQARKKHAVLVQRHRQATHRKKAQEEIRNYDAASAMAKFDDLEKRIECAEADADLVNIKPSSLDDAFSKLERDEELEKELDALMNKSGAKEDK